MSKYSHLVFLIFTALLLLQCEKEEALNPDEIKSNCFTGASSVRKVLFIGIDGCRTDAFLAANTPAFDSLMNNAYVNLHCDRGPFTVSSPGWSTLLHGVYPAKHGVTSNDLSDLDYGMYHDLFYYMHEANPNFNLAEVSHWGNFLRVTTNEDYAQSVNTDLQVKNQALYLLKSCVPDVLLLHFDEVDDAGHNNGFSPQNFGYLAAIEQTNNYTQEIMQAINHREQNYGEEWMIVVVTDHGGAGKSHSDQDDVEETRFVFAIVRLPGLARVNFPAMSNVDIMPTILEYMNIPIMPSWGLDGSSVF